MPTDALWDTGKWDDSQWDIVVWTKPSEAITLNMLEKSGALQLERTSLSLNTSDKSASLEVETEK